MPELRINKVLLTALLMGSFLPIWGTGLNRGQNFWQWLWAHTIFAPYPMYVPEELYGGATLEQSRNLRSLSTKTPEEGFTICQQNGALIRGKHVTGISHQAVSVPVSCPYGGKPVGLHHTHPVSGGGSTEPSEQDIYEARRFGLKWLCITVPEKRETQCHRIS